MCGSFWLQRKSTRQSEESGGVGWGGKNAGWPELMVCSDHWPLFWMFGFGLIHFLIPFVSFFWAIYKMRLVSVMILYVEQTWESPAGFYKHNFAELCTPGVLGNFEHLEWEPKIAFPKSSRVGLMLFVWTPIVRNMPVFNISKVMIYTSYSFPHS